MEKRFLPTKKLNSIQNKIVFDTVISMQSFMNTNNIVDFLLECFQEIDFVFFLETWSNFILKMDESFSKNRSHTGV